MAVKDLGLSLVYFEWFLVCLGIFLCILRTKSVTDDTGDMGAVPTEMQGNWSYIRYKKAVANKLHTPIQVWFIKEENGVQDSTVFCFSTSYSQEKKGFLCGL